MTDIRFRSARLLLALCLSLAAVVSNAQDESTQNSLGTFGTPNYPGNPLQRPSGQLGQQPGVPSSTIDAQRTRGLQNNNGQNTQDGRVRSQDPNSPNSINGLSRPFDLTPPKPGEFQKFVEGATGRLLPLFGNRFFADALNNRSPVDNVPVSADYTVGPGDEIVIRAWGSIDVDYRTTVDRNGLLNLPKIGSFNVSGVKAADLEKQLRAQIGRLYTNFELSVSLGQLRGLKVFVVGPAQRPGVFNLASQSTMLSAVVMAGGPSPTGSMRKVLLRRDGKVISELDIYDFLVQGDKSKDLQLAAGDVVVFQPAGPRVALSGALDTPAIYELKSAQEPVGEVLRYAGGTPTLANPNRAQLERIDSSQPKAPRFVEEFKLDPTGLQKPLRDGDVLTLLAISPEFANAVTLRGHVAQPLRYPFKPGMRIHDLIPDRDALITPDFYRRKNLLVQVIDDDDNTRGAPNSRYNGSNGAGRNNQSRSTTNTTNTYSSAAGAGAFADRAIGNGNGNGNSNVDAFGYANNNNNGGDNNYNSDNGNGNGNRNSNGYDNYDQDQNSSPMSRADRNRRAQDRQLVSDSKRTPCAL
jgi:polysaccharide export outer membrane protein